jgi:epoxyqueuosine reductase
MRVAPRPPKPADIPRAFLENLVDSLLGPMTFTKAPEVDALSARIKSEAQRLGFELVGFSPAKVSPHEESFVQWLRRGFAGEMDYLKRSEEVRRNPLTLMPWAVSVVSVGMNYFTPFIRPEVSPEPQGWISRYAWGDDYHDVIKNRLERLLELVRDGHDGRVEGRVFVDSGPVLERGFAGVAGIGWIGKNTHLISPKRGSWFFLGELFLSLPLAYDQAIRERCGRCDLCLKACPTGAFAGPYVLDARRCISYLTIELKDSIPHHLRPLIDNHIFGCDICQEICPYNVKAMPTKEASFAPREGLYAPDLIPLLSLTAEEFRRRFHNSPIRRAKRRGLLRNVAVALGNLKSRAAVPALVRALNDEEPLVRGHAAWALGQIGTAEAFAGLQKRRLRETEAGVNEEIEAALEAARNQPPQLSLDSFNGI